MSLTGVMWFLGVWFVCGAVVSLVLGRMMSRARLADAPDPAEVQAQPRQSSGARNRSRAAA